MILKTDALRNKPLLILANKSDSPLALPVSKITSLLKLPTITDRPYKCVPTSALSGTGLYEGLDWLVEQF